MKTEAEHLLYFSIPGFFIVAFVLFFLVLIGKTDFINNTYITLIGVSVIPIGYSMYQAYVVTGFYDKIWRKWYSVPEPAMTFMEKILDDYLMKISDEKIRTAIRDSISRRYILNFFEHYTLPRDSIDYIWRLINLINSRGIGMFSCCTASVLPILYIANYYLSFHFKFLPNYEISMTHFIRNMAIYYAIIALMFLIFNAKISHLKKILANFSQGVLLSNINQVDNIILEYLAFNTVDITKNLLEERQDENLSEYVNEAYALFKKGEWQTAYSLSVGFLELS